MRLIHNMKQGVGLTLFLAVILIISKIVYDIVGPLASVIIGLLPFHSSMTDFYAWLLKLLIIIILICTTLLIAGKLKRYARLKFLNFKYIVRLRVTGEPAMGLVTSLYEDMADGRPKINILYSHSPNPITGWVFGRDVGATMENLITIDKLRSLINEREEFNCVDDVVRAGYIVIYSDLSKDNPEYTLNQYFLYIASLGTRGLPGEVIDN